MHDPKVLVAALDWGWGHAARCVPVVRELQKQGAGVILAGSGDSGRLLQSEFPDLPYAELPAYHPVYGASGMSVPGLLRQLPGFLSAMVRERMAVAALVKDWGVNRIISDNRYGCYSRGVRSTIICHQLSPLLPKGWGWARALVRRVSIRLLINFDTVWVPDDPVSAGFSGQMSAWEDPRKKYIGVLSRLAPGIRTSRYRVMGIVSGPEPQRSVFESLLRKEFRKVNGPTLLVRGAWSEMKEERSEDGHEEISYLNAVELNRHILESALIVVRSGYSSVMDMAAVGARVIFIPTPGQPEQEYLARRLSQTRLASCSGQAGFDLGKYLARVETLPSFSPSSGNSSLQKVISEFL
jgi:hypothetical protein